MLKKSPYPDAAMTGGPQFSEAIGQINQILLDCLNHGYFCITISGEIGKGNRRDLMIKAGKSYKFTIPEKELPHQHGMRVSDPCDRDAKHANSDAIQSYRSESEAGDQGHGAARA